MNKLVVAALILLVGAVWCGASELQKGVVSWSINTTSRVNDIILLNESIYVGCDDGKIYALDDDGIGKWSYQTGGNVKALSSGEEYVLAASIDNNIYMLDHQGTLVWTQETPAHVGYNGALHHDKGVIAAGAMDGVVYIYNRDGVLLWQYKTDSYVLSTRVKDGRVIAVSDKGVYFLNVRGELEKQVKVEGYIASSHINDESIGLNVRGNELMMVNVNGSVAWNYSERDFFGQVHTTKDTLTVGSRNGTLYRITDGKLEWRQDIEKSVVSAYATESYTIASAVNNIVYLLDNKGALRSSYKLQQYTTAIDGNDKAIVIGTPVGEVVYIRLQEKDQATGVFATILMILVMMAAGYMVFKSLNY